MATGIRAPLNVNAGRLQKSSGDAYIQQLVMLALKNGDSENPFQDLGLGEFMIFGVNDELLEGKIRPLISRVFRSLESSQLAKLCDEDGLVFSQEGEEKYLTINYTNMETQERTEFEVPLPSSEWIE